MSYKPILQIFCSIRNKYLIEGKDVVLLAKKDGKYYRVEEYTGLIVKIYPKYCWMSQVPEIAVRFQNGEVFKIRAYLDRNITEYSFVSIYGIFTPKSDGNLEFTCKCGMVKQYDTLGQAEKVNPKYMYRFGIAELSRVKESTRYPIDLKGIEVLEQDNLWIYSSANLREEEQKYKEKLIEEDSVIDFSGDKYISIENSLEIESITERFANKSNDNLKFISLENLFKLHTEESAMEEIL